jgi:hypothetical protein
VGTAEIIAPLKAGGGDFFKATQRGPENHLRVVNITRAASVIRPFHAGGRNELARQPRVYGFDVRRRGASGESRLRDTRRAEGKTNPHGDSAGRVAE